MTVLQNRRASISIIGSRVLMRSIMPQLERARCLGSSGRDASAPAARLGDNTSVSYVDPSTGQHYPLTEARWCADNGHYLNLAPSPGLGRADIDTSRQSVWRYARALRVDSAHAVSLGEGGTP